MKFGENLVRRIFSFSLFEFLLRSYSITSSFPCCQNFLHSVLSSPLVNIHFLQLLKPIRLLRVSFTYHTKSSVSDLYVYTTQLLTVTTLLSIWSWSVTLTFLFWLTINSQPPTFRPLGIFPICYIHWYVLQCCSYQWSLIAKSLCWTSVNVLWHTILISSYRSIDALGS